MTKLVRVLESAPDAVGSRDYDVSNISAIVAINNARRIRPDWTHLVQAGDFPSARRANARRVQTVLSHATYVPADNAHSGFAYTGGTMIFSAAYYALYELRPDVWLSDTVT